MIEHIKTGKKISDKISDEMVSRFQKGSLDLTKLNELENEKWVSLSWLKEQIQKEIDKESEKTTFQINHSYQSGLNRVLSLLEEKE